jgi:NAD(P)-dependent dehydrogenase (short-subunit alcohol dehydrogenase family)
VSARLTELFGLDGKVALVTGGGRGIGRMIAEGFVAAGAARIYVASRNPEGAEEMGCIPLAADLTSEAGCRMLAADLSAREPRLDILVNNSGASWLAPLETYPEAEWDRLFQLNLKAPFFLTRALLPLLEAAGSPDDPARVINIGSIAGSLAESQSCYAYGLSKGALHQFGRMLAKELAPRHITVNTIAPGRFATRMTKGITDDAVRYARDAAAVPLGRWGAADDMAGLALLLASRAGAYITGSAMPLDGGTTLLIA